MGKKPYYPEHDCTEVSHNTYNIKSYYLPYKYSIHLYTYIYKNKKY